MFKHSNRWIALSVLVALVASTLTIGVRPAEAKSSTWKKVAIGAGVVTGYGLLKHKKGLAVGAGLVTAGSYLKYRHDKKKEQRYRANRYRTSRYTRYRYAR